MRISRLLRRLWREEKGNDAVIPKNNCIPCGHDHITEKPHNKGNKWMAQIFKETYKIDPLTISQSQLRNYSNLISSEMAFIPSKDLSHQYQKVDFYVINNLKWNVTEGDFKYRNENDEIIQVSIYNKEGWKSKYSYYNKIPKLAILLEPKGDFLANLEDGRYQIITTNKQGKF